ncbi:MAG: hypothetical protein V1673_03075 [Candidatus Omnitrophota bacterium]
MKKAALITLFLFVLTTLLPLGEKKAFAGDISCGDYDFVTRKKNKDGQETEELFRINNKTGDTWVFEGRTTGWVKLRVQE